MTVQEAIKAIKYNKPTSGYTILCEALDMAIEALEKKDALLEMLVEMESGRVCEVMNVSECGEEWCQEHCEYQLPQKECYLKYAEIRLG